MSGLFSTRPDKVSEVTLTSPVVAEHVEQIKYTRKLYLVASREPSMHMDAYGSIDGHAPGSRTAAQLDQRDPIEGELRWCQRSYFDDLYNQTLFVNLSLHQLRSSTWMSA